MLALGEARTHNPGITWCTVYKYRALTDCATRAACFYNQYLPLHCLQETLVTLQPKQLLQQKKMFTHGETRTRNLRFRRPTPYPLGHAGCVSPWLKSKNFQISNSLFFFISFFGLGVFVKIYITHNDMFFFTWGTKYIFRYRESNPGLLGESQLS